MAIMQNHQQHRRRRLGTALLLLAVALSCGLIGVPLYQLSRATEYPGATHTSDENLFNYTPNFAWRHTAAYRTTDPFPKVYNWYSTRFALGPEAYAQSSCILMARSSTIIWRVEEQMSVTVCNTPTDRMMFVMRAFYIRYSR
jgi:hypothetical protein